MEENVISQQMIDAELGTGFCFSSVDVLDIIPQRKPFVMVDSLLHFDVNGVRTSFTVRKDNILLENGRLDPSGILENIAQSCAVRIGFISAIRDMSIVRQPEVGETLFTSITIKDEIMGMTIAEAEVESASGPVAKGIMSTALKK